MRSPSDEELKLLRLVAAEPCATINQEDARLAPFCDDRSTLTHPDTFNRCLDLGWLKAWHDNSSDHHTAELTEAGRQCLAPQ